MFLKILSGLSRALDTSVGSKNPYESVFLQGDSALEHAASGQDPAGNPNVDYGLYEAYRAEVSR